MPTIVATQSNGVDPKAVEAIIAEIDRCPSWPLMPWKPTNAEREHVQQEAAKLEEIALNIATHSSADIRDALTQYKDMIRDKKRNQDKEEALFIINKFLFDVPAFVTWGSPEMASLRTGWWRPEPTERVLARWPWFSDETGRWHLTIQPMLLKYSGPSYDPVRHFDVLLATFGRRSSLGDGSLKRPDDKAKTPTVHPSEVKGDVILEQGTLR